MCVSFMFFRVEEECIKNTNPIIVSNTHMKKMEMQYYLNYAATYGYTIIMAITTDKFVVSSEVIFAFFSLLLFLYIVMVIIIKTKFNCVSVFCGSY